MAQIRPCKPRRRRSRHWAKPLHWIATLLVLPIGGCVEQVLSVDSDPPGAGIYLNDQEVGRTPMTTAFKWYGWYDVNVRKEGYETLKTKSPVIAPWWQWIPFDFFAEVLPIRLKDEHHLHYTLQPATSAMDDPARIVRRGERMRTQLETGANDPRVRTPKPGKLKPGTGPASQQLDPE